MSFISSNQSCTISQTLVYVLMDHSKSNKTSLNKTNKIIIHTSQTFTVTHSHTGTSGSNVMAQIEVKKKLNVSCKEFQKKDEFLVLT